VTLEMNNIANQEEDGKDPPSYQSNLDYRLSLCLVLFLFCFVMVVIWTGDFVSLVYLADPILVFYVAIVIIDFVLWTCKSIRN
jgi:hypothetical protein